MDREKKSESEVLNGEGTGRVLGCCLPGRATPVRACHVDIGSPALADLAQGGFG